MAFDPVVATVCNKLWDRSQVGMDKYKTTLEGAGLTRLQWLVHAQEEAMDLCNYLEMLLQEEYKRESA